MIKSNNPAKIMIFGMLILLLFVCGCGNDRVDGNITTPNLIDTTPGETTPSETEPEETTLTDTAVPSYPFPEIDPMSDELRLAVEEAFMTAKMLNKFPGWLTPENEAGGLRYYGTYGDVVVAFEAGPLDIIGKEIIADSVFEVGSNFVLYAYHSGNIMKLMDAYAQNLISAQDVAKAAEVHKQFQMWCYPWKYSN